MNAIRFLISYLIIILGSKADCDLQVKLSPSYKYIAEKASNEPESGLLLGRGGSGDIFKVYVDQSNLASDEYINLSTQHFDQSTPVALKFFQNIHPERAKKAQAQEFEMIKKLNSSSQKKIAPEVYRCGVTENNEYFIAMELMESDLFDYLMKHNCDFALDKRLEMFYDLMDLLSHLHQINIAHCDVKPENIGVTYDQNKLVLFDFERSSEDNTCNLGTLSYMAPDSYQSLANHQLAKGTKSDIYAMGILMLEIETNCSYGISELNKKANKMVYRRKQFQDHIKYIATHYFNTNDFHNVVPTKQQLVKDIIVRLRYIVLACLNELGSDRPLANKSKIIIDILRQTHKHILALEYGKIDIYRFQNFVQNLSPYHTFETLNMKREIVAHSSFFEKQANVPEKLSI